MALPMDGDYMGMPMNMKMPAMVWEEEEVGEVAVVMMDTLLLLLPSPTLPESQAQWQA